jgi:hypothetical protein
MTLASEGVIRTVPGPAADLLGNAAPTSREVCVRFGLGLFFGIKRKGEEIE